MRTSVTLLAILLLPAAALPAALTRGPYLQRGTSQGIVVHWRTDVATDSRVRHGASPSTLNVVVDDPTPTTEHIVVVTGLAPDTLYYYSVGSTTETLASGPDRHFITSPPTGSTKPFRMWVIGDSGTANQDARNVRDAFEGLTGTFPVNHWLMLGDNAYTLGTDAEYQAAVFDTYAERLGKTVVWSTFGNHEDYSSDAGSESGPYFDAFDFPRAAEAGGLPSGTEAYYSFDVGNVHFICLDSQTSGTGSSSAQMVWLRADLAATTQTWIVAFWHHPPYSKGSHDSDVDPPLIAMRMNALPVLEDGGVDLVLCGHSHSYERSILIDQHYGFSWTFDSTDIKDDGDGRKGGDGAYVKPTEGIAPHEGTVYVVAGSSGKTESGGSLDYPAMHTSLLELGSLVLDVNDNRLEARFLDDAGATRDTFTLVKGAPPTEEIITGAGVSSSNAPNVRVWDTCGVEVDSWAAYGASDWGVNVGAADVVGGAEVEIVTGPGPGPNYGPQVRGFQGSGTPLAKVNFYAYGTLRYGAHASGGDLDGDSHGEILTTPGPGEVFGPHVRGWDYDGLALRSISRVNFFAYQTLRYGARCAGGGLDADAYAEIVTGAGAGQVFGPHVRTFDYDGAALAARASFFAFSTGRFGAAVSAGDTDGDGLEEIAVAHGPDPTQSGEVAGFAASGATVSLVWTVLAFASLGGAEPAVGDMDFDGRSELVVGSGWGSANPSTVRVFAVNGGTGTQICSYTSYSGQSYGTKVVLADTGWP